MESIERLNTATTICPYCKGTIIFGSLVCVHCLNNLQSRKSSIVNNQMPMWYIVILMSLIVLTFVLPTLRITSGALTRYRLNYLNNRPSNVQAAAEIDQKPTLTPTKAPMPEHMCINPDEVTIDHLGQEICVQGSVEGFRLDDRGIFRIKLDQKVDSLILIDDERTYDVTIGQCIKIRDVVMEWQGIYAIELGGDLPGCD